MRIIKYALQLFAVSITINTSAQNVGIGIAIPGDNLQVHSGAANSTGISFTNQASGTSAANGMRIGMLYDGANSINRYGFINLPAGLPFNIWQGLQRRFTIGSNGAVGIGMAPYAEAALSVNGGGYFFAKNNIGAAILLADTTNTPSLSGSGISVSKRLYNQNHFFQFVMEGTKPQAYIEANFKNGTNNQRTSMIMFDSTGDVGIGTYILDSALHNRLHLFGSQTIQSGNLQFYGPDENYDRADHEITFAYNRFGDELPGPNFLEPNYNYFIRHNNRRTTGGTFFTPDPEYKRGTFAIGRFQTNPVPNTSYREGDRIAIAMAPNNKVGIGRYPATNDAVHKIFVDGNTHFSASRLTLDRPSSSNLNTASLEFRSNGAYRGALGWDQSAGRFFFFEGESNSNVFFINNGRMGILRDPATNAFEVNGNASKSSSGDWLANSDARLKKDIQPLQGALQKLQQLNGITYQWNDDKTGSTRPDGKQMGFTAQNIQQVFPELVSTDAQGFLQTAYGTYDALYVEAIKELKAEIDMLRKELDMLKKDNAK